MCLRASYKTWALRLEKNLPFIGFFIFLTSNGVFPPIFQLNKLIEYVIVFLDSEFLFHNKQNSAEMERVLQTRFYMRGVSSKAFTPYLTQSKGRAVRRTEQELQGNPQRTK